jgi:hypothetical protein
MGTPIEPDAAAALTRQQLAARVRTQLAELVGDNSVEELRARRAPGRLAAASGS